jgi:tRNA threonylcarbamoyladenosine biosynthesis protein TsaE
VARRLLKYASSKILCFHGQMGAGKTTLIKAIVKELGGSGIANSPTFGIVNEYHDSSGGLLGYHFDLYRLEDENEAWDIGLEEYLTSGAWIFMEWPELVAPLLPEDSMHLFLEMGPVPGERLLRIGATTG